LQPSGPSPNTERTYVYTTSARPIQSRLSLGGLEIAGRVVVGDGNVGGHPAGDRVVAMDQLSYKDWLLQLTVLSS
jgi:hypothetical protein